MSHTSEQSSSINAPMLSDESAVDDHLHNTNSRSMVQRTNVDDHEPIMGEGAGTNARFSRVDVGAEQLSWSICDMVEDGGQNQETHADGIHAGELVTDAQGEDGGETQGYPMVDSHAEGLVTDPQGEWSQIGVIGSVGGDVAPGG
ncbi:hypothetical protein V6N13_123894 [Hibiscus sabdariffa]|uniref:Uncharacterized protein n=1 Tax=Hibiscus sabdariffa TaxID=183260 RepID=A0ABR2QUU1_9ROSI